MVKTNAEPAMHSTILFPTDLTVASLNVVRHVLHSVPEGHTRRVILLHGYRPASSIVDLLFTRKEDWLKELMPADFEQACEVIRNKFESRITSLKREVFVGFNQNAFNGLLEGEGVDQIYMPDRYAWRLPSKRSFDLNSFIERCPVPVQLVPVPYEARVPEKDTVAEVFHGRVAYQSVARS